MKKLDVIKTQVQIRKKILKQDIHIVFSRSRKQRPVNELLEELCDFITRNSDFPGIVFHPEALVGSRIKHRFEIDGEMEWYGGVVISYDESEKVHEIAYDGEQEHCFFDLTLDIANDDLIIETS